MSCKRTIFSKHPWPSWLRRQTQVLVLFEANLAGCIPFRFLLLTNRPAPSHTTFFDQFYIAKNGPLNTLTSVGEENEILPQNGRELFRHLFFLFFDQKQQFSEGYLAFFGGRQHVFTGREPTIVFVVCLLFVCCLFVVCLLLFVCYFCLFVQIK